MRIKPFITSLVCKTLCIGRKRRLHERVDAHKKKPPLAKVIYMNQKGQSSAQPAKVISMFSWKEYSLTDHS